MALALHEYFRAILKFLTSQIAKLYESFIAGLPRNQHWFPVVYSSLSSSVFRFEKRVSKGKCYLECYSRYCQNNANFREVWTVRTETRQTEMEYLAGKEFINGVMPKVATVSHQEDRRKLSFFAT